MSWLNGIASQLQNFAQGLDHEANPATGAASATTASTDVSEPLDMNALLEERSRLQDSLLQLDAQHQEERTQMILIKNELQSKLQQAEAELSRLRTDGTPMVEHEINLDESWGDDWGITEGGNEQKLDSNAQKLLELQKSLDEAQMQLSSINGLRSEVGGLRHENLLLKNKLEAMQEEIEMLEAELETRAPTFCDPKPSSETQYDYEGFCKDVVSTLLGGTDFSTEKLREARDGLKHLSSKVQCFEENTGCFAESLNALQDQKHAICAEKAALEEELRRLLEVESELKQVREQLKKATDDKFSLSTKIEKSMRSQAELKAQIAELNSRSHESLNECRSCLKMAEVEAQLVSARAHAEEIQRKLESFMQASEKGVDFSVTLANIDNAEDLCAGHGSEHLKSQVDGDKNCEVALLQELQKLKSLVLELLNQNVDDPDEVARLLKLIREQCSDIQLLQSGITVKDEELGANIQGSSQLESMLRNVCTTEKTSGSDEEVARLKQRLDTSEQQLELLRHSLESVSNKLEATESQKQQAYANVSSIQQELDAMKEARTTTEASLRQLANEKEQMVAVVNEKCRENVDLRAKLDGLMGAVNSEKQARLQSEQLYTHLQQQVELQRQEMAGKQEQHLETAVAEELHLEKKVAALEQECQRITRSLSHRNEENAELRQRIQKLLENESKKNLEIERLASHLVEVEESYTKEAITSEKRTKTLQHKLTVLEESARNTDCSTQAMTALASQRAEILEAELTQALSQRDEALDHISTLEDQIQQSAVSLASLQLVLEHMQTEKDNGAKYMKKHTEAEQKKLSDRIVELEMTLSVKEEMLRNLSESSKATSELSHQLEEKKNAISKLQEKLNEREQSLKNALQKNNKFEATESRVEKQLIKNMLLGYFTTDPDKKQDVLRCITGYLEFTEEELRRINFSGPRGLFGIFSGTQQIPNDPHDSFTDQLIAYIEKESTPSTLLRLPVEPPVGREQPDLSASEASRLDEKQQTSLSRPNNLLFNHFPQSTVTQSASTTVGTNALSEQDVLRGILAQPNGQV